MIVSKAVRIASEKNPESDHSKSTHLVVKINSLFRSLVSLSYESYVVSSQSIHSVGFYGLAITDLQSDGLLEISNPSPNPEDICKMSFKPDSGY
jgi:hypothetical protein